MLPDMRNSPSCTCAVPGNEPAAECNRYKGTLDVFYKVVRQVGGYKDFMNKLHIYVIKELKFSKRVMFMLWRKAFLGLFLSYRVVYWLFVKLLYLQRRKRS